MYTPHWPVEIKILGAGRMQKTQVEQDCMNFPLNEYHLVVHVSQSFHTSST